MSKSTEEPPKTTHGTAEMAGIMLRGMHLLVETVLGSLERVGTQDDQSGLVIREHLNEHLLKLKAAQVAPEQLVSLEQIAQVCRGVHQFQALLAPVDPEAPELGPTQLAIGCLPRHLPLSGQQLQEGLLKIAEVIQDLANNADWERLARYGSVLGEYDYALGLASALDVREQLTGSVRA